MADRCCTSHPVPIAGIGRRPVRLDACGTGRIALVDRRCGGRVEVMVDGQVLLTGHLRSATTEDGE